MASSLRVSARLAVAFLFITLCVLARTGYAQETGTLLVKVSDEKGEALPAVLVTARNQRCEQTVPCPADFKEPCNSGRCDCSQGECKCCIDKSAKTDESGVAAFNVEPGIYSLTIARAGFAELKVTGVQVGGGSTTTKEVKFDSAAPPVVDKDSARNTELSGVVTDINDRPLAGVVVEIQDLVCVCGSCPADMPCNSGCCDCRSQPCKCCIDQSVTTNEKGSFLVNVPSGQYRVRLIKDKLPTGTLLGIPVEPRQKSVKLQLQIVEGPAPEKK